MAHTFVKKDGTVSVYDKKSERSKGRPSRFTDDLQDHAVSLSKIGLNNVEIAKDLDIPWSTFGTWVKKFPDFSTRLNENRNLMLKDAKKCLAKRIEGFSYKETKVSKTTVMVKDENGKMQPAGAVKIKTETTETYHPPDTKAAIYVLDKRSKHFRRQPEAADQELVEETFNVYVQEIKPPKEKKKTKPKRKK